jgi:hypothetical protein
MKIGTYRHFKWNMYEVIWLANHSETGEELVIYKALYESKDFWKDALWVRPKKMFLETIERDWKIMPRFEYIGDKKYGEINSK